MTFNEWCSSKQIKGNFKEALYRSLAAEYTIEKIDGLGQDVWAEEWNKVLRKFMDIALGVMK